MCKKKEKERKNQRKKEKEINSIYISLNNQSVYNKSYYKGLLLH